MPLRYCIPEWRCCAHMQGTTTDGKKFDSSLVRPARRLRHAFMTPQSWSGQSRLCASQDRSEPFSFTLGQGQVIKVWAMS